MTAAGQKVPQLLVLPIYSTLPSDLQVCVKCPIAQRTLFHHWLE